MDELLVTLVKYRYEYRAHILRDKLEEAGIKCAVSNRTVFGDIDGVKVMVLEKDYDEALKIYKEIRGLYDNHSEDVIEENDLD